MSWKTIFILILLAGLGIAGVGAFRAGPAPTVEIDPALPGIGKATAVTIRLAESSRGLGAVRVELEQGETREVLDERSYTPRGPLDLFGDRLEEETIEVVVGRDTQKWLKEGPATLRVVTQRAPAWLLRPGEASQEATLNVKLRPPSLAILSSGHYVKQGGAGVVVYRVDESTVRSGVRDDWGFFPGYPLPGGEEGDHFALFGAHWDDDTGDTLRVVAFDDVENESTRDFVDSYTAFPGRNALNHISREFIDAKIPTILEQMPDFDDTGRPLENFLMVNREIRQINRATVAKLAEQTAADFLWNDVFMRLPGSAQTANYGDRRRYVFEIRAVDRQTHLGVDMAKIERTDIPASNAGRVVYADFLGIYGNCVILDHGFGLQTLYAHLSSMDVSVGDEVERGGKLGRSGQTGLAGGDHLHFGVFIHGRPVNPVEWFDDQWIRYRIVPALDGALEFPAES